MEVSISGSVLGGVIRAINLTTYTRDCQICLETRLAEDLKLSRIGRFKLALSLEEIFRLELSDDVLEQAVTVADVVNHLSKHYFRDKDFSCDADEADDTVGPTAVLIRLVDWLRRKTGAAGNSGSSLLQG